MFEKVKQAIHVGRHVTDIMRLPCVYSCHKEADGTLCYLLYDWDEQGQYVKAHEGQWLCEGYDGKWTVKDEPPALQPSPDVSVNIWCYLESIRTGHEVTASCSIGDETVKVWSSESSAESHSSNAESRQGSPTGNGIPYKDIVEQARLYIHNIGGFEKFAEWGLVRPLAQIDN